MRSYGFLEHREEGTVRDVLSARAANPSTGDLPALVHVHPSDTVRDAIEIMTTYGVSQLPVLTAEPPVVMGEVVGAVDERELLDRVFSGATSMTDPIGPWAGDALRLIGLGESITAARAALSEANALLVTDEGKPVAVITRQDLLSFATA